MSDEPLLTARELAERLGVQPGTVVDMFEDGRLPGFRLGGRKGAPLRFDWDEVRAAMEAWRGKATPERGTSHRASTDVAEARLPRTLARSVTEHGAAVSGPKEEP